MLNACLGGGRKRGVGRVVVVHPEPYRVTRQSHTRSKPMGRLAEVFAAGQRPLSKLRCEKGCSPFAGRRVSLAGWLRFAPASLPRYLWACAPCGTVYHLPSSDI